MRHKIALPELYRGKSVAENDKMNDQWGRLVTDGGIPLLFILGDYLKKLVAFGYFDILGRLIVSLGRK
jgi:hypothetical protein